MAKPIPKYLRLHTGQQSAEDAMALASLAEIRELSAAFEDATGWQLSAAMERGFRTPLSNAITAKASSGGQLKLSLQDSTVQRSASPARRCERSNAQTLLDAMERVLQQLLHTEQALWERESELATAIPVLSRSNTEQLQLASRLQAVLKGGAQVIGCQAVAVYLLDDATSQLKLRSHWGLPNQRFLDPPRPLKSAVADLEALVGHAVVLEDARQLAHWNLPEDFAAAVCVPISSPSVPLGTLWMFSNRKRDFSDHETNLVEIIAGRIASDLERDNLLRETEALRTAQVQLNAAVDWQDDQLPSVHPMIEGWEIGAVRKGDDGPSADLFDWHIDASGYLSLSLLSAHDDGMVGSLTASMLAGSLRALRGRTKDPARLFGRMNELLWQGSAGDQWSSVFHARLNPQLGHVRFAAAGPMFASVFRLSCRQSICPSMVAMGVDPNVRYRTRQRRIAPGEVLLISSLRYDVEPHERPNVEAEAARIGKEVMRCTTLSAEELAQTWATRVCEHVDGVKRRPTVLLARRLR